MNSSKELHKTDVVMFFITHKFFHNNRPGKPLPGHSSFISPYFGGFFYFTGYNIIMIPDTKECIEGNALRKHVACYNTDNK